MTFNKVKIKIFLVLIFFIFSFEIFADTNQVSQEGISKTINNSPINKDKIVEYAPFTKDFIWQEKSPDPYNHYIAVAFSALDMRDNRYPFYWFNMQYGQHTNLLRLPGRFSLNLGLFGGRTLLGDRQTYGDILSFYLGCSYEFIFTFKYFYITAGLGVYIRDNKDQKIGSNFIFGPKIGIGKTFMKIIDLEIIYQHFSNGYLASPNRGINLLALQIGLRF